MIKVQNYHEMSMKAAQIVIDSLKNKQINVLGFATGGTPEGFYKYFVQNLKQEQLSLKDLHTVNLDEYIGLSENNPNSYHHYMEKHLFQFLNLKKDQTHLPNGNAENITGECKRYEQLIQDLGGINLQLLGVGSNGHIGFNEPGSSFHGRTQVVDLAPSTIEANARYFTDEKDVPNKAITMGIQTIMESKSILLLASGAEKAEAIYQLMHGAVNDKFPVTILQKHPSLIIIADQEARSLL
ncbi:glucosamine-6-phosphate deaminase [Salipaludibacillus neizhouensis]|nr:glucosamine-6-phosphate deaminase [Salipaludibacillus neizhouensis]